MSDIPDHPPLSWHLSQARRKGESVYLAALKAISAGPARGITTQAFYEDGIPLVQAIEAGDAQALDYLLGTPHITLTSPPYAFDSIFRAAFDVLRTKNNGVMLAGLLSGKLFRDMRFADVLDKGETNPAPLGALLKLIFGLLYLEHYYVNEDSYHTAFLVTYWWLFSATWRNVSHSRNEWKGFVDSWRWIYQDTRKTAQYTLALFMAEHTTTWSSQDKILNELEALVYPTVIEGNATHRYTKDEDKVQKTINNEMKEVLDRISELWPAADFDLNRREADRLAMLPNDVVLAELTEEPDPQDNSSRLLFKFQTDNCCFLASALILLGSCHKFVEDFTTLATDHRKYPGSRFLARVLSHVLYDGVSQHYSTTPGGRTSPQVTTLHFTEAQELHFFHIMGFKPRVQEAMDAAFRKFLEVIGRLGKVFDDLVRGHFGTLTLTLSACYNLVTPHTYISSEPVWTTERNESEILPSQSRVTRPVPDLKVCEMCDSFIKEVVNIHVIPPRYLVCRIDPQKSAAKLKRVLMFRFGIEGTPVPYRLIGASLHSKTVREIQRDTVKMRGEGEYEYSAKVTKNLKSGHYYTFIDSQDSIKVFSDGNTIRYDVIDKNLWQVDFTEETYSFDKTRQNFTPLRVYELITPDASIALAELLLQTEVYGLSTARTRAAPSSSSSSTGTSRQSKETQGTSGSGGMRKLDQPQGRSKRRRIDVYCPMDRLYNSLVPLLKKNPKFTGKYELEFKLVSSVDSTPTDIEDGTLALYFDFFPTDRSMNKFKEDQRKKLKGLYSWLGLLLGKLMTSENFVGLDTDFVDFSTNLELEGEGAGLHLRDSEFNKGAFSKLLVLLQR